MGAFWGLVEHEVLAHSGKGVELVVEVIVVADIVVGETVPDTVEVVAVDTVEVGVGEFVVDINLKGKFVVVQVQ